MNLIDKYNKTQVRKNLPEIRTGDRVKVHQKIREGKKERIQIFEGVVIKVAGGRGINGSFTVRRIASGVGVEKSFPFHLPSVVKVEKLKSAKVRQARIYYVRGMVGRAAQRMKKEKTSAGVWEDVIAAPTLQDTGGTESRPESVGKEKSVTPELSQAELEAEAAAEKAEEKTEGEKPQSAPTPRQEVGGQETRPESVGKAAIEHQPKQPDKKPVEDNKK